MGALGRLKRVRMRWTYPSPPVIAGLDPAIPINPARLCPTKRDGRVKPGHDP
jgi:hypothetical protein